MIILAHGVLAQNTTEARAGNGWRMIQESASPDGSYALAWGQKGKSQPKINTETHTADFDEADVVNYVVDLKSGTILGRTKAQHFGDRQFYNHESCHASWSHQNRFVVQTMSWKWHTAVCDLHQIMDGKTLSPAVDIIEPAKKAAFKTLQDRAQLKKFKEDDFAITIEEAIFVQVGGETHVTAKLNGQIPKRDDVDAYFEAKVFFIVLPASKDTGPNLKLIKCQLVNE